VSTRSRRRTELLRWLPVLAWMALIFILSSISGLRASDNAEVERPLRVLAHLTSYAVLAALLLYALAGLKRPRIIDVTIAYGLTVVYGMTDEFHQSFVPNRTGRLDDLMVDAIGAAIGLTLGYVALRILARAVAARER